MGQGRSIRRKVSGIHKKPNPIEYLAELLGDFYDFLEQKDQPSDEIVRGVFIETKDKWLKYCDINNLTDETKDLFVLNVEKMWRRNQSQA